MKDHRGRRATCESSMKHEWTVRKNEVTIFIVSKFYVIFMVPGKWLQPTATDTDRTTNGTYISRNFN